MSVCLSLNFTIYELNSSFAFKSVRFEDPLPFIVYLPAVYLLGQH